MNIELFLDTKNDFLQRDTYNTRESVCLLLALATQEGWEVHHMDVKTTFINGKLTEKVYVAQPPSFVHNGHEHEVLKIKKALYELLQTPRA